MSAGVGGSPSHEVVVAAWVTGATHLDTEATSAPGWAVARAWQP